MAMNHMKRKQEKYSIIHQWGQKLNWKETKFEDLIGPVLLLLYFGPSSRLSL